MELEDIDVKDYLSYDERKNIDFLNNSSNKIRDELIKSRDFLNIPLSKLSKIWASKMNNILEDLAIFFKNIRTYSNYFEDINDVNNWWRGILKIISEFSYIMVKNERSIYFGITLIMLSIGIYFIQISS